MESSFRRQGLRILLLALGGILVSLAVVYQASGSERVAAWCFDYASWQWLGYSEGVPGSVSQDVLTDCLEASADQERAFRFRGQLVPGGALLDLGDTSLFWPFEFTRDTNVLVTAFDDRVIFGDTCDRRIEVSGGVTTTVAPGYPCIGRERISVDPRTVSEVDFTIYVTRRQFIVDASEGWYHIHIDRTGASGDPTPRGWIQLRSSGSGVWVSADREIVDGTHHFIHEPVVGTIGDRQQYRAYDWETRIAQELIPLSFNHSAYFLLPDWDAYWAEVRRWIAAIVDDLYRGNIEPVELHVLDIVGWEACASGRTIYTSYASANTILHELAHVLAGTENGHNEEFTAMVLMVWDRYVPSFDTERALQLADRYSVRVGNPPDVLPVSRKTTVVRELFAKVPPPLPSDDSQIDAADFLLRVELELGQSYSGIDDLNVATSEFAPSCRVESSHSDGTTYFSWFGPRAEFSVNPGGEWNGLELVGYSNAKTGERGVQVTGTPTVAGRVLVRITTQCPGGRSQEPRFVGYSEIIVVDPAADPG